MGQEKTASKADRKEAVRRAMAKHPPMGVYAVRERATGIVRLGSSENIPAAFSRLRLELETGSHRDPALQRLWKEQGPDSLGFEILDELKAPEDPELDPYDDLLELDRLWMDKLAPQATHLPFSLPRRRP
jgi:hypothetical protein